MLETIQGAAVPHRLACHKEAVLSGQAVCCGVYFAGDLVGAMVLAIENIDGADVLIVKAAGGDLPGRDLTCAVLPAIEQFAVEAGCQAVRFETARPGLMRKTRLLGYDFVEVVMEKRMGG